MHAINFALKRAHLRTVAVGQWMLDLVVPEMTPARFDLLYYIRAEAIRLGVGDRSVGARRQRDVGLALGLDKSTVSKMIGRLEEIGWVSREPLYSDRRFKVVTLTRPGLRAIAAAMRFVFRQRPLARPYDRIARVFRPAQCVASALGSIWSTIDGIARFMGDESSVWYSGGAPYFSTRDRMLGARQAHDTRFRHDFAEIDRYLADLGYFFKWVGAGRKKRPKPNPYALRNPTINEVFIDLGFPELTRPEFG